jgi:transmembrane sensor
LTKAAVERALAWRFGNIDLAGQSLAQAAAEFNRYNKRKIIIADSATGAELLDGTFQFNDPEGFALAVSESLAVPVDFSNPSRIIIGLYAATTDNSLEGYS